mmetsp:Transcript_24782/g.21989  ORF Transcript_24782/g.21989 Transcript_24782/m.21989 type:complete len:124 (+) Transcript_24782:286-657(+)
MKSLKYIHTIYDKVLCQEESQSFIHSLKGLKNISSLSFDSFCYSNPKIDTTMKYKIDSWMKWVRGLSQIRKFSLTMGYQHSNQLPAFRRCIFEVFNKKYLTRINLEFKFFRADFYEMVCELIL